MPYLPTQDIIVYVLNTKKTVNITEGMMGYVQTRNILRMEKALPGKAGSATVTKLTRTASSSEPGNGRETFCK